MQISRMGFMEIVFLLSLPLFTVVSLFSAAVSVIVLLSLCFQIYAGSAWNVILADALMLIMYAGLSGWTFYCLRDGVQRLRQQ
jgi:hypothetical protein